MLGPFTLNRLITHKTSHKTTYFYFNVFELTHINAQNQQKNTI